MELMKPKKKREKKIKIADRCLVRMRSQEKEALALDTESGNVSAHSKSAAKVIRAIAEAPGDGITLDGLVRRSGVKDTAVGTILAEFAVRSMIDGYLPKTRKIISSKTMRALGIGAAIMFAPMDARAINCAGAPTCTGGGGSCVAVPGQCQCISGNCNVNGTIWMRGGYLCDGVCS
jgi:hypothetical protein